MIDITETHELCTITIDDGRAKSAGNTLQARRTE
jgi:hypothetical protein